MQSDLKALNIDVSQTLSIRHEYFVRVIGLEKHFPITDSFTCFKLYEVTKQIKTTS